MKSSAISSKHQSHTAKFAILLYYAILSILFVAIGIASMSPSKKVCHEGFANRLFCSFATFETTDLELTIV